MENQLNFKAKVLIVDDDILIAESSKLLIKKAGYDTVGTAVSGTQAIEMAKEKQPDIILMDINLGNSIDGITAAEEIQKFADIPFIFVTAYSDRATIERAKKIGPFGYLIKPFDNRELLVSIETTIYKHSLDKKIKEQELLFRTVANFAYEWEFWLLPDLSFKYCSPSCERVTGYKAEEFLSNPKLISNIVHPDDRDEFNKKLQASFSDNNGQCINGYQFRIIDKQGSQKYINHTCSPIYDDKGNFLGRRVTNVDITDRKTAEESLRKSEETFRELYEQSPIGYQSLDENGNFLMVNKVWLKTLGYSEEEVIGKWFGDFLAPEFVEPFKERFNLFKKLGSIRSEFYMIKKDGSQAYITFEGRIGYDQQGKFKQTHCVLSDITERKKAEEALRNSEERFKQVAASSGTWVWEVNAEGLYTYVSPTTKRILGYSPEEIVGKKYFYDFFSPEIKEELKEAAFKVFSNKGSFENFENPNINKFGEVIILETSGFPILDVQGNLLGYRGADKDITDRKRAEKALRESEEQFRTVYNTSPAAISISEIETSKMIEVNDAYLKVFGYSRGEVIGKTSYDLGIWTNNQDREMLKNILVKNGYYENIEITYKNKNGSLRNCLASGRFIFVNSIKYLLSIVNDITEIKRAADALLESEKKFRMIVETANEGIMIADREYITTFVNNALAKMLNYQPSELIGTVLRDLIYEDDLPDFEIKIFQRKKGLHDVFERRYKRKDGSIMVGLVSATALFDKNNKYTGSLAMITDITEREKTEKALRESEQKFRSIFEDHSAVKLLIDPESGEIVDANNAAVDFYGWSISELKQMKIQQIGTSKFEEISDKLRETAVQESVHHEYRTRIKDGSIKDIEVFTSKIKIGGKSYLHSIVHDITDRKLAEEEIRKLSTAVEQSQISIIITNLNASIEYVNPYFTEVTGYTKEEALRQNPRILKSGETSIEEYRVMWEKLSSGLRWSGVFHNKKKNGELFWESAIITPIKNQEGHITHFIAVKEDITNQVNKENELKKYQEHLEELVESRTEELDRMNVDLVEQLQRQKELEMMLRQSLGKEKELNELKTRFISTASHEFRTPLTSVLSSAELIQRYGKKWSAEKISELVDRIKNAVDYVTKLLDEVLTISRVESGKITFEPEQIKLYDFCLEIINETRSIIRDDFNFVFNFHPEEKYFNVDRRLLKFILSNLLSNAFKYSPQKGKVELNVYAKENYLTFEVKDEGIGIPENDKQNLFEPFFRCTNSGNISGTGLGLSIVKQAVEIHHGDISVQSQLGKGSVFTAKIKT